MKERNFKGVWIPAEVWLDERLTMLEKGIFIEINGLDSSERGCYASNRHIAEFCQCSERKVSEAVAKLTEMGYIRWQAFNGRQRELKSNLPCLQGCPAEDAEQNGENCEADTQNQRESNTDINTNRNTGKKREDKPSRRPVFIPPSLEEVKNYCKERENGIDPQRFIDYYTANGWMMGKTKMQDWRAGIRLWESRERSGEHGNNGRKNGGNPAEGRADSSPGVNWGVEC